VGHTNIYCFTQAVGINHGLAVSVVLEAAVAVITGINEAVVIGSAERSWNG